MEERSEPQRIDRGAARSEQGKQADRVRFAVTPDRASGMHSELALVMTTVIRLEALPWNLSNAMDTHR
jgi:hypothetical protein